MKDPFLDLLEESLEVSDFELGETTRRLLLAAAASPGATAPPMADNVLPFVRPDAREQQAFNWLMGESPADIPLMDRLTSDPEFFETVASERHFLKQLRQAMREMPAAAVPVMEPRPASGAVAPRRTRRILASALAAVAAAIAMMLTITHRPGPHAGHAVAADEAQPPSKTSPGGPRSADDPTTPVIQRQDVVSSEPSAINADEVTDPEVPTVGRTAAVIPQDDDLEPKVLEAREAALLAAKELFGPAQPSFDFDPATEGASVREGALALNTQTRNGGAFRENLAIWDGITGSGPHGGWEPPGFDNGTTAVPEPGGCIPVVIGFVSLLLRRRSPR